MAAARIRAGYDHDGKYHDNRDHDGDPSVGPLRGPAGLGLHQQQSPWRRSDPVPNHINQHVSMIVRLCARVNDQPPPWPWRSRPHDAQPPCRAISLYCGCASRGCRGDVIRQGAIRSVGPVGSNRPGEAETSTWLPRSLKRRRHHALSCSPRWSGSTPSTAESPGAAPRRGRWAPGSTPLRPPGGLPRNA